MGYGQADGFGFGSNGGGGGGGSISGAVNGLSVNGSNVVFGQDTDQVGNPAILLNNREIPMDGNLIALTDAANGNSFSLLANLWQLVGTLSVPNSEVVAASVGSFPAIGMSSVSTLSSVTIAPWLLSISSDESMQVPQIRLVETGQGRVFSIFQTSTFTHFDTGAFFDMFQNGGYWAISDGSVTGDSSAMFWVENSLTDQVSENAAIRGVQSGSYNTLGGPLISYGGLFLNGASRVDGLFDLTNLGIYASAAGGQFNYAGVFENGVVLMGAATSADVQTKLQVTGAASFQLGVVNNSAGPVTLNATTDNYKVFTNTGAVAVVVFNLPPAVAGLVYQFIVTDADGIRVVAATGDTIRILATATGAGGNLTATAIGSTLYLVAVDATQWIAIASLGLWT